MKSYIAARLLFAIPTMLGVLITVFLIMRSIPGDPAAIMLGKNVTKEQIKQFRDNYGLNDPLPIQLGILVKNFFKGDLGKSIKSHKPVLGMILRRLPKTAELALLAILLGVLLGVAQGIVASVFHGRWPDIAITAGSTLGMSTPSFYIGLLILMVFAVKLGWIPVIGLEGNGNTHFQVTVAPVLTMMLGGSALIIRTTRSAMLEIMGEDYIRTARAKGLTETAVLFKHALRNAAIPIITVVGDSLAHSFAGAIIIETVFVRPGIGKLLIGAVASRDYPVVQGTVVFIAFALIMVILIVDIIYGIVDPRIRLRADMN
jgi:peptide/nickel transport system permease protein